jgi:catechol 2,3-dioxygenase-like lactoylglutathione lyase family enzyme
MSGYPSSNPTQFVQGSAVLHVPDVAVAVAFYRDVLGFACDFGDDNYAVVWRDNSALHFVKRDASPAGVHPFQWVRDVDALHRELKEQGAPSQRNQSIDRTVFETSAFAIRTASQSSLARTSKPSKAMQATRDRRAPDDQR